MRCITRIDTAVLAASPPRPPRRDAARRQREAFYGFETLALRILRSYPVIQLSAAQSPVATGKRQKNGFQFGIASTMSDIDDFELEGSRLFIASKHYSSSSLPASHSQSTHSHRTLWKQN